MATNVTDSRYAKRVYQGMLPPFYDRVDVAYPSLTTEDYAFSTLNPHTGLLDLMSAIRIIYTDDTKCLILSVEKTYKRPETD